MSRRNRIIAGTIALLSLLGLAGLAIARQADQGPEIRTEEVIRRNLVATIVATGYIQPKRKVDISADISGRVTQLFVEEGQYVERGEILLRIDPTSYEANVRRATASVSQARAQAAQSRANVIRSENAMNRARQLGQSQNLIAAVDIEQAETDLMVANAQLEASQHGVEQAEASLSEAREQLRKTTIAAPMTGQVTRLNIEQGETAVVGTMNNPGSLLLTIADLSEMEARVRVTETDIPGIQNGDSADVRIDAYPGKSFPGRVTQIANSALSDPSTRNQSGTQSQQAIDFEVIVTLTYPPADLRPDLTATAEIVTETRSDALTVPIVAVTVRDAEGRRFAGADATTASDADVEEVEGVFVVRGGVPEWVPVQVGIVGEWYFEVVSGLSGGETIVAGPYAAIRDLEPGSAVRIIASEPAGNRS